MRLGYRWRWEDGDWYVGGMYVLSVMVGEWCRYLVEVPELHTTLVRMYICMYISHRYSGTAFSPADQLTSSSPPQQPPIYPSISHLPPSLPPPTHHHLSFISPPTLPETSTRALIPATPSTRSSVISRYQYFSAAR